MPTSIFNPPLVRSDALNEKQKQRAAAIAVAQQSLVDPLSDDLILVATYICDGPSMFIVVRHSIIDIDSGTYGGRDGLAEITDGDGHVIAVVRDVNTVEIDTGDTEQDTENDDETEQP